MSSGRAPSCGDACTLDRRAAVTPRAGGRLAGASAVAVVLAAACSPGSARDSSTLGADQDAWRELVADVRCGAHVTDLMASWGARGRGMPAAPASGHREHVRIPTDRIGQWVLLDVTLEAVPSITRVTGAGGERVTFGEDCGQSLEQVPAPVPVTPRDSDAARGFTDADLSKRLARGAGVVVYVWSPHMPLSVAGYSEIARAAAALGLDVVPLLFAGSDRAFAETESRRGGIPPDGLREVAAVELLFRDAQVHAPTVLVFDAGRVSAALPGYRDADGYRAFLAGFLDAGPGDS